jgi:hypothetical protein
MKKTINAAIILFITILLSSCSSVKVVTDKDDTVDFTKFKTFEYYGWSDNSDKILNRFDKERIEHSFGEELAKRGLTGVEKGSGGDLIITLYIVAEQKTQTTATTTGMGGMGGYGYGYGYMGHGPGYGWGGSISHTTYSDYDYTVGTLIIDIYDAKEKKLIWESIGTSTVNEKTKGREERIAKTVALIMQTYPVAPSK